MEKYHTIDSGTFKNRKVSSEWFLVQMSRKKDSSTDKELLNLEKWKERTLLLANSLVFFNVVGFFANETFATVTWDLRNVVVVFYV